MTPKGAAELHPGMGEVIDRPGQYGAGVGRDKVSIADTDVGAPPLRPTYARGTKNLRNDRPTTDELDRVTGQPSGVPRAPALIRADLALVPDGRSPALDASRLAAWCPR